MKKLIAILVSALFATAAFAQAPAPQKAPEPQKIEKVEKAEKAEVKTEKADAKVKNPADKK